MTPPTESEIDTRHRNWLRDVLLSGCFRRVLEIGSFCGYSTLAFIDALKAQKVEQVHLCDIRLRPQLAERIAGTGVVFHSSFSRDLLAADGDWDLVFVDGNHSAATVKEETELLLRHRVPTIVAHDTQSHPYYAGCDGPQHLKLAVQRAGYFVIEDSLMRDGERTHRGMLFASTDMKAYEIARQHFVTHCD